MFGLNTGGHSRLRMACGAVLIAVAAAACAPMPGGPGRAKAPKSKVPESREITIGMWAGDETVIATTGMPRVNARNGSRSIRGPINWRHPVTGENLKVYERRNVEKDGSVKLQLLTLRKDGTALARVFDSRPGQPDRVFIDDAFFPIGNWTEDQPRQYRMSEFARGRRTDRIVTLTLDKASFKSQGNKKSMRYEWVQRATDGTVVFDERFTYSPGQGLTKFEDRLK